MTITSNYNRPVIRSNESGGGKTVQTVLIIVLIVIAGLIAYQFLFANKSQKTDQQVTASVTTSPTPTPTTEESVTPTPTTSISVTPTVTTTSTAGNGSVTANVTTTVPGNWKVIENGTVDYNFFRPNSYYFRVNGNTMGIDPAALPSDGSYKGVLTNTKIKKSQDSVKSDYTATLQDGFLEGSVTAGSNEWVLVRGTLKTPDTTGAAEVKLGFLTHNGATYVLELLTTADKFASNQATFDTELGILSFK
jgi:hypothetical protein